MRPSVIREWSLVIAAVAAAACGHETSPPSPLPCIYAMTASPTGFGAAGGSGAATVTTTTGCTWTARAGAPWLTFSSAATGNGPGAVTFAVAPNADPTRRTCTLTIEGQIVSIDQDGVAVACASSISPTAASIGKDGGAGSFAVATPAACAWTAASDVGWLTLTTGASGTGNGSIGYAVARNDRTSARSGTIRAAGQVFTLTQAGDAGACEYSVTPVAFAPCMGSTALTSQVATGADCTWTATSDTPWLTVIAGASGSGPGPVRFGITDNWDAPRTGNVKVRWPAPTAGQNLLVSQAGCYYAVTRDAFSFAAGGGSGSFDVMQQSEPYTCGGPMQNACVWSAVSDSAWISVSSSMPRSGDDRVAFTVAANGTAATRIGSIAVRGKLVRITQGG